MNTSFLDCECRKAQAAVNVPRLFIMTPLRCGHNTHTFKYIEHSCFFRSFTYVTLLFFIFFLWTVSLFALFYQVSLSLFFAIHLSLSPAFFLFLLSPSLLSSFLLSPQVIDSVSKCWSSSEIYCNQRSAGHEIQAGEIRYMCVSLPVCVQMAFCYSFIPK